MNKEKESQVRNLILGANAALEAHKFAKSKQICREALQLEPDNPNIHMIMLLADYKVTEIEDLKDCDVDFQAENYKNVRRYASKDLHDELNKYLKDEYILKENKPSVDIDSIINNYYTKLISFLKKQNYKELAKDFFGIDYLNSSFYNNKLSQEYLKNKEILLHPTTDSVARFAASFTVFSLALIAMIFFMYLIMAFGEGRVYPFITGVGSLFLIALYAIRIKSIFYLQVIVTPPSHMKSISEIFGRMLVNLIGSILALVAIYYLYYIHFNYGRPLVYSFWYYPFAFIVGLIPQRIIPIYFQQCYSLFKNFNYIFA